MKQQDKALMRQLLELRAQINQLRGTAPLSRWFALSGVFFLPPAYVVRREGNVLTRICPSICLSVHRGVPQPGLDGGWGTLARSWGCPNQVHLGGYPGQVQMGGTLARSGWVGEYPCQVQMGVPWPGMRYPQPGMGTPVWTWDGVPPIWTWTWDGVPP